MKLLENPNRLEVLQIDKAMEILAKSFLKPVSALTKIFALYSYNRIRLSAKIKKKV